MCNWNSIHLSLCAVGWNIILSHKGDENSKLHSWCLHCLMLVPGLLVFHCDPVTFGTHRNSLQMTSGLGWENHSTSTFSCFGSVLVNFFFFLIWYKPGPTSQDHLGRGNLNWKNASITLAHGQFCGELWVYLWGINNGCGRAQPTPGQVSWVVYKNRLIKPWKNKSINSITPWSLCFNSSSRFLPCHPLTMDYNLKAK